MKTKTTDLQIRGIPVKLRDQLRRKAESNVSSMSDYLIRLIEQDLKTLTWAEWRERHHGMSRIELDVDAAELIRQAREERDAHWDELFGLNKKG
ncbi:MAG: hypothetical protein ABI888_04075 [Chloroflexota bacterium]